MVDPDGRINKDHATARRRGGTLSAFCVPLKRARRLALSRSINACNPSCISDARRLREQVVIEVDGCSHDDAFLFEYYDHENMASNSASNDAFF